MTLFLSILSLAFISTSLEAKIEESYFVQGSHPEILKMLADHQDLVVDHVSSEGFELYGPKGTAKYLEQLHLRYEDISHDHKAFDLNYPTHAQITQKLQALAARFPQVAKLTSIGKSVMGKDLWVMKISDNVNVDEVEPEFKYISSMHGDEITGRELTVQLIDDMLTKYGSDAEITELINNTEIYIMPSMNPDGSERRQRANANGIDLNRNFPDFTRDSQSSTAGRQPETQAVMNFQASRRFALSANFHGGAVCVNYPWDTSYDRHPLDQMAQELSLLYADLNPEMRSSTSFSRGITNGAQWYVLKGGMQDWSYFWYNDFQVTVELSESKWPGYGQISGYYKDNRDSMITYLKAIHQGAGFKSSNKNLAGTVSISEANGRSLGRFAFDGGEFYKVLPKGEYTFSVQAANRSTELKVVVDEAIRENGGYQLISL